MTSRIARGDRPLAGGPTHDKLGAERQHHRRHVVAGITVRDIAADRAAVTHLGIGDLQRRLAQDRHSRGQQLRRDDLGLRGHGADPDRPARLFDSLEPGDRTQIDQVRGVGEPQLHHGDQAVPAREQATFVAMLGQQRHDLGERGRPMVLECARYHRRLPGVVCYLPLNLARAPLFV